MLVPFLRHRPGPTGDATAYDWHFFVPCRNEQAVIGASLARLRESFPQAHVWVIDDASDDDTAAIVAAAAAADGNVHLVRRTLPEAQTGKGDALNAAYRALSAWLTQRPTPVDHGRVVVGVVDAEGVLAPDALGYAAGVFADPAVGAAQCQVQMFAAPDGTSRFGRILRDFQDAEFRTTIAAMQVLRGYTLSVGLGGNGQFSRLAALDAIGATGAGAGGQPWHGSLLEDYELSLHLMLAGWQTRYLHEAVVSQEAVITLRALIRQRTRWCQRGMQCVRYLREVAVSPHITPAATLEMAYFLSTPFQELVGMVVWPLVAVGVVALGIAGSPDLLTFATNAAWVLPLVLLTGIAPFASWGVIYGRQRGFGPARCVAHGLGYWLYSYLPQIYVVSSVYRLAKGRTGWEKTARLADAQPGVPGAGVGAELPASAPAPSPVETAAPRLALRPAGGPRTAHVTTATATGRAAKSADPANAAHLALTRAHR
ncbi:MAG: glycosyltransferase [Austwickia sp.]|jgi:1,2-diacylglycerol 3-beta-glucosyltransferase|nr:MAG: glycosyltransferase [Austwickia sp.]